MDPAPHRPLPAPRPPDDQARLAVLRSYAVLDTDPEQQYDDLVTLAAAVCGTPTAAISLIDEDRQWFKARVGLELAETPRDQSFCAHAILTPDQLLEVPDAAADPRFADNPLVTAPGGIAFYAGTPLVTEDDQALGALCVIDDRPRRLTDQQKQALEALGRQVVAQLELRRKLFDVAKSEERVRASEARYRHLSLHDPLTGLANRSRFLARVQELTGTPLGLCFLDLDGFKQVNDEHGHEAGDRVLTHVATALTAVAAPDDLVARIGGDEFVLVSPGADERALHALTARIEAAVEVPVEVAPGVLATVGASVGWTVTDGSVDADEAVRRADRAMYDAKAARRRLPAPRRDSDDHGSDLRRALDEDELVLHFQPVHEVRRQGLTVTSRLVGAEALVRWQHPVRGTLGAEHFVPLAERTGLVAELGRHVLDRAVAQAAAWDRDRLLGEDFRVHVNLAVPQLHAVDVPDAVASALEAWALDPARLCLEITEAGPVEVPEFTPEAARALTDLGVQLALDDFGTGVSSLTLLLRYPFDVVKVDGSRVAGLGSSVEDEAVVEAVLGLARRLGTTTVAEGVETVAQLQRLVELGCTRVQGYLLGRPQPAVHWQERLLLAPATSWRAPAPRRAREAAPTRS